MMRTTLSRLLIGSSLFLLVPQVHAQVVVRCGSGTVTTAGFQINNQGEVVFGEDTIACGDVGGGTELPDPLQLAITAPPANHTIDVSNQAVNVPFSGTIVNYTPAIDACSATVSPAIPGTPITLNPVDGVASATLTFPEGQAAGTYNVALNCTRIANDQEIVVNNPAPRAVIVQNDGGPGVPAQCETDHPIPGIFAPRTSRDYSAPHSSDGGWGVQPGEYSNWRHWHFQRSRTWDPQGGVWVLNSTQLRSWKFQPPDNHRWRFQKGGEGGGQYAISITECPGQFGSSVPTGCQSVSSLNWRTQASGQPSDCILDSSKEYYVNMAAFDLPHFIATGNYRSTIECADDNCQVQIQAQQP